MRPRMSFALVIFCITLLGGVCVQRKIFSCGGRRRRWALLHQHPYWIFFSKEARQHTARRAAACVRTRSYRCVPFGSK